MNFLVRSLGHRPVNVKKAKKLLFFQKVDGTYANI